MSAKPRPAAQGSHLDLRCYHVTGAPQEKVVQVAAAAAAGGAGVIQVRSKPISVRDLTALAIDVAAAVEEANPATKVLIDDRVDVAAALMDDHHIHGVHIGQDDLDPRLARRILGEDAIIGLTTGTLELVRLAHLMGAEAVFLTNSLRLLAPVTAVGEAAFASLGHPAVLRLRAALRESVARACGVTEESVA
mgnify:CR=1 FL=1